MKNRVLWKKGSSSSIYNNFCILSQKLYIFSLRTYVSLNVNIMNSVNILSLREAELSERKREKQIPYEQTDTSVFEVGRNVKNGKQRKFSLLK